MKIFLGNLIKITDTKYSIGFIHYMPFDEVEGFHKTEDELKQMGALVDTPTMPEVPQDKKATMYYNIVDNTAYYELEDIPTQAPSDETRISALESAISTLMGV